LSKIVEVGLTDTLMAWDNDLEAHLPSGDRHSTYYLSVPDSWADLTAADLKEKLMGVFRDIYHDFNEHFRQVEPDDINYLAPLDVNPRVLTPGEEKAAPWLQAKVPAVWEWTPCVVVDDDGKYTKVEPGQF
jgi:hypothetical protein